MSQGSLFPGVQRRLTRHSQANRHREEACEGRDPTAAAGSRWSASLHKPIEHVFLFLWEILGLRVLRVGVIGDEVVAAHCGDRDWVRELAEMEWSSQESICIYDP
jgi:hypothetical protein